MKCPSAAAWAARLGALGAGRFWPECSERLAFRTRTHSAYKSPALSPWAADSAFKHIIVHEDCPLKASRAPGDL